MTSAKQVKNISLDRATREKRLLFIADLEGQSLDEDHSHPLPNSFGGTTTTQLNPSKHHSLYSTGNMTAHFRKI